MLWQLLITGFVTIVCCLIANTPAIIYARKGLKQGQANGKTGATNAESAAVIAQDTNAKADEVIASTKVIHDLVNSGSDVMKAEIVKLREALGAANLRTDTLTAHTLTLTATIERLLANAEARQSTGLDRRAPAAT